MPRLLRQVGAAGSARARVSTWCVTGHDGMIFAPRCGASCAAAPSNSFDPPSRPACAGYSNITLSGECITDGMLRSVAATNGQRLAKVRCNRSVGVGSPPALPIWLAVLQGA